MPGKLSLHDSHFEFYLVASCIFVHFYRLSWALFWGTVKPLVLKIWSGCSCAHFRDNYVPLWNQHPPECPAQCPLGPEVFHSGWWNRYFPGSCEHRALFSNPNGWFFPGLGYFLGLIGWSVQSQIFEEAFCIFLGCGNYRVHLTCFLSTKDHCPLSLDL